MENLLASKKQGYGVNTGFGQLANVRIGETELKHLQENLLRYEAQYGEIKRAQQPVAKVN